MNLQDHQAPSTLDGIGFRVIARRWNTWLNDPRLHSKNPLLPLSAQSALLHLRSVPVAGPWKSVFCTWEAALTRRQNFLNRGATEIYIYAVDLEHRALHGSIVNAYSVAFSGGLPNLQYYGYTNSQLAGFPKEFLIPRGIPDGAAIACIPAMGQSVRFPVHLGEMEIPGALATDAGGSTARDVRDWVSDEIYSLSGVRDMVLEQRLMRAMCIRAWDY